MALFLIIGYLDREGDIMKKEIPKVIHYCWFGKNQKSKLVEKCIDSWKKFCPDFKIVEWNEDNYDISKNRYMKEAYDSKKWAFVSDYARLDILYNYGGVYLDTDVELIRRIDFDQIGEKGFFSLEGDKIATGLGFAVQKNDELLNELLQLYNDRSFFKEDNSLDVTTCVISNEPIFKKHFKIKNYNKKSEIENYTIFPNEFFCPFNYITGEMNITKNTIGIHWYGATWMNPKKRLIKKIKRMIKKIVGIENINKLKQRKNEEK